MGKASAQDRDVDDPEDTPVLLIHTGQDAGHLGPDDRERSTARCAESPGKPAKHATDNDVTVLLVHNGHDAHLAARLPTRIQSILGLTTRKEAQHDEESPANPALNRPLPAKSAVPFFKTITAMMPSITTTGKTV